jgi:hypothetical protein
MEPFDRGYRYGYRPNYEARRPGLRGWWHRASLAKIFIFVFFGSLAAFAAVWVVGLSLIEDQVIDGYGIRTLDPTQHSATKE